MLRTPALAAVALAIAAPAAAQQAGTLAPFQGARVEGLLGYDGQQGPFAGDAGKSSGIVYGVAAGYDIRRGNIVFGPEVELTGSTTDTRGDGVFATGDRLVVDSGRDLYAGGRAGFVLGERVLAYGKLGYTNAKSDFRYTPGTVAASVGEGSTSGGIRAGAGAEVQMSGNTFVKAEYRYSDYGSDAIDHRNQVVAGFGFRF